MAFHLLTQTSFNDINVDRKIFSNSQLKSIFLNKNKIKNEKKTKKQANLSGCSTTLDFCHKIFFGGFGFTRC